MSEGGVNLTEFPQALADRLGIDLFPAQIIASMIFLMLPLLPTLLLTRGRNGGLLILVGIGALSCCVALGWFPIWSFTIICVSIALLFSKQVVEVFQ